MMSPLPIGGGGDIFELYTIYPPSLIVIAFIVAKLLKGVGGRGLDMVKEMLP